MTKEKEGGMYVLLPKIVSYLEKMEKERFTAKELYEFASSIDLSKQAIINNIGRLINNGFLVKHEYRIPKGNGGKLVEYSISPYVTDFIREVLYDENKI